MQDKIEIFTDEGLSNIFEGLVIPNSTTVIGYRLENQQSKTCLIFSRSPKDILDCYSASGFVHGVKRRAKRGKARFFPRTWTREQVITAICEAYETKQVKTGVSFILGTSEIGLKIRLWLDESGKVFDAMPLLKKDLELEAKKPSHKRICKICGQPKHRVCFEHHNFPKKGFSKVLKKIRYYSRKLYFNLARKLKLVE
jgi:hypothetical protein